MITYDDERGNEVAAHIFEIPDDAEEKEYKRREKIQHREMEKLRRKLKVKGA